MSGERGSFRGYDAPAVHWGAGCARSALLQVFDDAGYRRAFLVTTRSVGANPALAGAIEAALGPRLAGRFAAIAEHAPVRAVAEAVEAARAAAPDVLVSLGGGSPIDAAKAVAYSLATGVDLLAPDPGDRRRGLPLGDLLPHVAIPTTLSAAEMGPAAGFTSERSRQKTGISGPPLRPTQAIYDADLALHTPPGLWLSTGIRAIDHAVETLLAPGTNPHADALALEALRRLPRALRACKADPADRAARTEAQIGAWLSAPLPAAMMGLGHMLGKRIGARHGIPHGVTSCLLLPHVIRFRAGEDRRALARMGEALGGDPGEAIARLITDLDLPRRLAPYGLTEDDLAEAVRPLVSDRHPAPALLGILRSAM